MAQARGADPFRRATKFSTPDSSNTVVGIYASYGDTFDVVVVVEAAPVLSSDPGVTVVFCCTVPLLLQVVVVLVCGWA
jgi:hypothetical protein